MSTRAASAEVTPLAAPGPRVTIGLMNGSTVTGRLSAAFSPYLQRIGVERSEDREGSQLATRDIAYVGFHRDPGAARPALDGTAVEHLKVHMAGGSSFLVGRNASTATSAIGFYGVPLETQSTFNRLFFFAHGIEAKEKQEPIGAMLLKKGVVSESVLEEGLAIQEAERTQRLGQILVEQEKIAPEGIDSAHDIQKRRRLRIGEALVEMGLCSPKDIEAALAEQRKRRGKKLGEVLVEMGVVSEREICTTLAKKFHLPFVNLDEYPIDSTVMREAPLDLVKRYGFLPVQTNERGVVVAISDPLARDMHDVLRFQFKSKFTEVLVAPSQLKRYVQKVVSESAEPAVERLLKEMGTGAEADVAEPQADVVADSAVVKLANQMLLDAYRRGASDVHVEPNPGGQNARVRFRIDGDCVLYQELPSRLSKPLVARLKIMARVDISEHRKPQDGSIRIDLEGERLELRLVTIPTVEGTEDVVLRILATSKPRPLEELGMSEPNLVSFRKLITKPYGLVLCVGPTGSGKTTTLHSALAAINTVGMKVWTAEDPVEIVQPGLRQVQVKPKIGLTFAAAMRSFLRADPDVIMIGEMRDLETASTAIEASLTGHLVLSTLHTNSAPETITRLLDMGLEPFTFSDALLGILSQRLTRGLCPSCREQYVADADEHAVLCDVIGREEVLARWGGPGELKLWRGKGCATCGQSGYKGRIGLHELLVVDEELRRAMQRRASADEIRERAIATGMTTLLRDGVEKAMAGMTDLKQVLAVSRR